ncbi:N-carbamoyl-L-amino acid hydrolase [Viridothelium virens]|uniref:N-carbamoyl-L-amino acid hydrolase n=1 Tax=Viridothelium virens TaxID=1048519 RepID=A0A6A6GU89_VIRVR|nr:N-carbamoyl-L-amino acid hydrolase [Viridothelium virens]
MSIACLRPLRCSSITRRSNLLTTNRIRHGGVAHISACRSFSSTPRQCLATIEMSEQDLRSLKVNQDRLMNNLHYSSEWGKGERWGSNPTDVGMSRLALSPSDKQARDWFATKASQLGCTLTTDAVGNQFAIRPGRSSGPPTCAGSHLDTQPAGGRYDGILGVTAGLELLEVLNECWIETEYPVGVINWTNEEGARFPVSMVASGVWSGAIPLERAHNLQSVIPMGDSATMESALRGIGYLGEVPASWEANPIAAHFELHIEQGPHLVRSGRKVGVVEGVQAYRWFSVTVTGRDTHTGTTDFPSRADALLAASRMILASHNAATRVGRGALASTGILEARPGSTNTVPGRVRFSLDIRAPKDEVLDQLEAVLREEFERLASGEDVGGLTVGGTPGLPCGVEWRTDSVSEAIKFHPDCINCVAESSTALFGEQKVEGMTMGMTSGAGHDSVYTSKRCPTSMIFVPCRDGISHNPAEYCEPEDCAIGAQVLLGSVLRYDKLRATR